MIRILALDMSLTSAGWATNEQVGRWTCGNLRDVPRLVFLRDRVIAHAKHADVVALEGYSYGAQGNAILNIAELGGVVRVALTELGVPWTTVAPTALKKFATGKGNAGKPEVLAAAIRKLEYEGASHDEADALWLHAMTHAHYSLEPGEVTNDAQRTSLAAVKWPMLK